MHKYLLLLLLNLHAGEGIFKNHSSRLQLNAKISVESTLLNRVIPGPSRFDKEIKQIAVPAMLTCAFGPLLMNIESSYMGQLPPVSLAALASSSSLIRFAFFSFRSLTHATTTLVAQANGQNLLGKARSISKRMRALSLIVGLGISYALTSFGGWMLSWMGAPCGSDVHVEALKYLRLRALAAPGFILTLVNEGVSQGFGNTRFPLVSSLLGIIAQLGVLSISHGKKTIERAGLAATIAVYVTSICLSALLARNTSTSNVNASMSNHSGGKSFSQVTTERKNSLDPDSLKKTGATEISLPGIVTTLLVKNISLMGVWTYLASAATRMGISAAAAYQVVLVIWVAHCIIHEGLAVAAQVLTARYEGEGLSSNPQAVLDVTYSPLRALFRRLLKGAWVAGTLQALIMMAGTNLWPKMLTSDINVLAAVAAPYLIGAAILPLTAFTVVSESILMGLGQFKTLALSICLSCIASCSLLEMLLREKLPFTALNSGEGIWFCLGLSFVLRGVAASLTIFRMK